MVKLSGLVGFFLYLMKIFSPSAFLKNTLNLQVQPELITLDPMDIVHVNHPSKRSKVTKEGHNDDNDDDEVSTFHQMIATQTYENAKKLMANQKWTPTGAKPGYTALGWGNSEVQLYIQLFQQRLSKKRKSVRDNAER